MGPVEDLDSTVKFICKSDFFFLPLNGNHLRIPIDEKDPVCFIGHYSRDNLPEFAEKPHVTA